MNISGNKRRLVLDIVRILFGEPAEKFSSALISYGPCPLGFIQFRTQMSLIDLKTIALAMYAHGIINIKGEGSRALLSLSTFPLFVLSAPSLLLDEIRIIYNRQDFVDVLDVYIREGVVAIGTGSQFLPPAIEAAEDVFRGCTDELFKLGFLARGIMQYNSFSSADVRSLERRISNLQLIKKRGANNPKNHISSQSMPVLSNPEVDGDTYCIDWNRIAQFLRSRYVVSYVGKTIGKDFIPLVEQIVISSKCGNYSHLCRMSDHADDQLRGEQCSLTHFSTQEVSRVFNTLPAAVFLERIDALSSPWLGFLNIGSDGSSYEVRVPNVIRLLQHMYIDSFAESNFTAMHRRVFSALQSLQVADTRQLEESALVSDKDARCAMYDLCRLGMVSLQAIPKTSEKNIAQSFFVWRYDEESAINAYANIVADNARRILSKIEEYTIMAESLQNVDANDATATLTKDKCAKYLSGFHGYFLEIMKVYVLFSEM